MEECNKANDIRKQIDWLLDRIEERDDSEQLLKMIDTIINRVYLNGKP